MIPDRVISETDRLAALSRYDIVDSGIEEAFEDIVRVASTVCEAPIAGISFITADRQWFKAIVGAEMRETTREVSFCTHTIAQSDVMIVPNAMADPRFCHNPLVTGDPHINFYAGVPLINDEGAAFGALCVVDVVPRCLGAEQQIALKSLAHLVVKQMDLRLYEINQSRLLTELKRAEAEHENLLAATPSIMIAVNETGRITSWNAAAERILETKAGGVVGRLFSECRINWTSDIIGSAIKQVNSAPAPIKLDGVELRCSTGEVRLLGLTIVPVADSDRRPMGFLLLGADITERCRQEEALRKAEQNYRAIYENSPEGIFRSTDDGKLLSANPAAATILRYQSATEFVASINNISTDIYASPAAREEFHMLLREYGLVSGFECKLRCKDGKFIDASLSARVVYDDNGQVSYFEGTVIDLTYQKIRDEALRSTNQRLETLVHAAPVAIITTDAEGMVQTWNPAAERIFGWTAGEVIGGSIPLLPGGESTHIDALNSKLQSGESLMDIEWLVEKKDKTPIHISLSAATLLDCDGNFAGMLANIADITARKRAEETLSQTSRELADRNLELAEARDAALAVARLKSEFLANMSHEIRTPMNGVVCMTDLLLDTNLDQEQNFFAHCVKDSAGSLLTIINDILDFSRLEAGKLSIDNVPFSLSDALEDAAELLAPQALKKNIELSCLLPPITPTSATDYLSGAPDRIKQIVTNLVANAIKFTPDGGSVRLGGQVISETKSKVRWKIFVSDTGIGISEDRQSLIFESFTQSDGSTTRKYGGTGLGLTISRQLATLMGGEIGLDSTPGSGSTFWIDLTFDKHTEPLRKTSLPVPVGQMPSGARILLVEPSDLKEMLINCLLAWGANVTIGSCDCEGLSQVLLQAKNNFDLIVWDIDSSTNECWNSLGKDLSVPVVAISKSCVSGEVSGGNAFNLRKPVRQKMLLKAVNQLYQGPDKVLVVNETRSNSSLLRPSACILVADDNPINQIVAQRLLMRLGFDEGAIDVVCDGRAALDALSRKAYDLVLLDIQMPEMDGLETVRAIRVSEVEGNTRLPVIALTAHAMQGDAEECLAAGMDDYLTKPIDSKRLEEVIARWLIPAADNPRKTIRRRAQKMPLIDYSVLNEYTDGDRVTERELLETLLQMTPEILSNLRQCQLANDSKGVEHWAHSLKGSVGVFGLTAFVQLCKRLEEIGRSGNAESIEPALLEIEEYWKRVEAEAIGLVNKGTEKS